MSVSIQRRSSLSFIVLVALGQLFLFMMSSSEAFSPTVTSTATRTQTRYHHQNTYTKTFLSPIDESIILSPGRLPSFSSSIDISAATLDPTTVLSDLFAGLIGSPAILLIPIVAALGVAGLIAFLIISYANPQVEDDEQ